MCWLWAARLERRAARPVLRRWTAMAAMRAGAGLVTAAVPEPALAQVAGFAAELMTRPLPATASGEIAARGLTPEFFEELTKGMTVLAIGPGMGQSAGALKFLAGLLEADQYAGSAGCRCAEPDCGDADAVEEAGQDERGGGGRW